MKNNNFFLFEKAKRQKTSRPRGRSSNNGGEREANFLENKIKIFTKKERKSRKTVEKRVRRIFPLRTLSSIVLVLCVPNTKKGFSTKSLFCPVFLSRVL